MVAKRTVGIFADYNASEKTLCALYLATHVVRRYRYVAWIVPKAITPESRYLGFSHQWDGEVIPLTAKTKKIKDLLTSCEMCFFLEENELLQSLLPAHAKTALFLDHHALDYKQTGIYAKKYTYLLSTSPYISKKLVQPNLIWNDLLWPFDPAVQIAPKSWLNSGSDASLLYNAYGMSFIERQCVQQISEIVKECCPASKSVICYYDNSDAVELGKDPRTYDWKLFDYLKQADWIIDLNPRPLMGFFAAFAGTLGLQWSCFDLPPNTDEYSGARRHLVPYPKGGLTLDNSEKIAMHLVRQLTQPFSDDTDRNRGSSAYINRLTKFTAGVNKLLGVRGNRRGK